MEVHTGHSGSLIKIREMLPGHLCLNFLVTMVFLPPTSRRRQYGVLVNSPGMDGYSCNAETAVVGDSAFGATWMNSSAVGSV